MYAFDYVKPGTVADAIDAMKGEGAQAISGGQTLIPTLKQRLASPATLVDLTGIGEMKGICLKDGAVAIAADWFCVGYNTARRAWDSLPKTPDSGQ